jgi:hypothetical protein
MDDCNCVCRIGLPQGQRAGVRTGRGWAGCWVTGVAGTIRVEVAAYVRPARAGAAARRWSPAKVRR